MVVAYVKPRISTAHVSSCCVDLDDEWLYINPLETQKIKKKKIHIYLCCNSYVLTAFISFIFQTLIRHFENRTKNPALR